jgi:hypothetical protein
MESFTTTRFGVTI